MNGNYANFRIASKTDVLEARVEKLEKAVFARQKPIVDPVKPPLVQYTGTPNLTNSQVGTVPLNKKAVGDEPEYNEEPLFDENGMPIPF